ncbi:MAG: M1 family aminopeptidase [Bacteroidota bacterium]
MTSPINRALAVARLDLRAHLANPLLWVMVALAVLATMSLNGTTALGGDADEIGPDGLRPFVNSPYAIAWLFSLGGFLAYPFFAGLLGGLTVLRDDEARVGPLLFSTPLSPGEYLVGKLTGVVAALGVALLVHLAALMVHLQFLVEPGASDIRGPFRLSSYLVPFVVFAVPTMWTSAVVAFVVGAASRRPLAVYAVPITMVLGVLFFLWTWRPPGLDPTLDQLLMVLDPSGLRWVYQVLVAGDPGVTYYNTAPLAFDGTFWLNRLVWVAGPLLGLVFALRRQHAVATGARSAAKQKRRWLGRALVDDTTEAGGVGLFAPLRDLGMTQRPPGFWASVGHVLRAEVREMANQPLVYVALLFVVLLVGEFATEQDALGGPALLTAGTMAVGSIEVLTALGSLLLLFTLPESVRREARTRFAGILYAMPVPTSALLLAKGLANGLLIALLMGVCGVASLVFLAGQGTAPLALGPFVSVWGGLLTPTFLVWGTFVAAVLSVSRNRFATYGIGLVVLALTAYAFASGRMTWVANWPLWATLRWSDLGWMPLNDGALLLNRAVMLALGVALAVAAWRWFPRRDHDGSWWAYSARLVRRNTIGTLGLLALPLALGGTLAYQVHTGFQGQAAEDWATAYWKANADPWGHVPPPAVAHLDLQVDLQPENRRLDATGTYTVVNRSDAPMAALPFTNGYGFSEVAWTLDDGTPDVERRPGLDVVTLSSPLGPGDRVDVSFAYALTYPRGITRNGGGTAHFLLPEGVLLSTYRGEFVPVPGVIEGLGAPEPSAPRDYPDGWWQDSLATIDALAPPFTARLEVTAPQGYTVTSEGTRTDSTATTSHTTVVWETDYPVRALNLMAGRWDEAARPFEDGTNAVYHHPSHAYHVEAMLDAMALARTHYADWFGPYPWRDLRINEFPDLQTNATAFPTNVSMSESAGFLTRTPASADQATADLAFVVTAHEVAHMWWGHLVAAAEGPGTGVLIEGMADYATLLLVEEAFGVAAGIAFAERLEARFLRGRRAATAVPLVDTREGRDEVAIYNQGAWVMWMLHTHLGRDAMVDGLRAFVAERRDRRDAPALQDLLLSLRPYAADSTAYDEVAAAWFESTTLPAFIWTGIEIQETLLGHYRLSATLENIGDGRATVEVAATSGERFGDDGGYVEARQTVTLAPGTMQQLTWTLRTLPERLVVDPDARVLMRDRDAATVEV